MFPFYRVDQTIAEQRRARLGLPTEGRLTLGQSVVVIAGLSVLAWAVLIVIIMGLRAAP